MWVPGRWEIKAEANRAPTLPFHLEHHAGQGKKPMVGVEMAGAHRKIGGQDAPAHLKGGSSGRAHLPAGRLEPFHGQLVMALPHLEAFQGSHVIADQVGAGSPPRHAQPNDGSAR